MRACKEMKSLSLQKEIKQSWGKEPYIHVLGVQERAGLAWARLGARRAWNSLMTVEWQYAQCAGTSRTNFIYSGYWKFRTLESTAVEQVVACALVTQRALVRSPVGKSFLGEVFSGFSSPIRQMSGSFRPPRSPNIIWPSLSSILIHYGHQWPEMLTRPKPSNIHT